jgi:hypothetical protein
MLALSENAQQNAAADTLALAPADTDANPGIDAGIHGGDRIMMWLLTGFFVLLGGILLSEIVLKGILGIQV